MSQASENFFNLHDPTLGIARELAPGNVPHTIPAGPEGCSVLDVFSPPRAAYRQPGSDFAAAET